MRKKRSFSRRDFLALSAGALLAGASGCRGTSPPDSQVTTPTTTLVSPPATSVMTAATTAPTSTLPPSSAATQSTRRPGSGGLEMLYWNRDKACNGYTLFGVNGVSFLIDMEGGLVNTWPIGTNPQLMPNGNLIDGVRGSLTNSYSSFHEFDWSGKVLWQYQDNRTTYVAHHDFLRIFDPKLQSEAMLYIAMKTVTNEQAVAAGCNPAGGPYDGAQVDAVVEVEVATGNVVWEWWFLDHGIQNLFQDKANYTGAGKGIADFPGRLDLNLPGKPLQADWLHCNSLDYNQALDQVVINAFNGEFYVIDHGGTFVKGNPASSIALAAGPAGDFLYRFGDPARYGQGDRPSLLTDWTHSSPGNKQIGPSHNIQWIDAGLPGAGHFLVFNNGQFLFEWTPQSYILEIDGNLDTGGVRAPGYVNPPRAGYHTLAPVNPQSNQKESRQVSNQVVWSYATKTSTAFSSYIVSSCQRLPNGNTLICAGTEGHIFEVTPTGELVWDYVIPVAQDQSVLGFIPDQSPGANVVFRAYRYTPDYPGLRGKDLHSRGLLSKTYQSKSG